MQQLSPSGQQAMDDIARRHGFSLDAVLSMLESVVNGNGTMAQFSHPEFSGPGQWMRGGMTMVSDMFNHQLKNRVDGLCAELARLLASQPGLLETGSFQSQGQGGQQDGFAGAPLHGGGAPTNGASLFVPPAPGQPADWWGADLRWPDSTGAQNGVRYACFSQARRLAIELNGRVTVYDTLDHRIGGFSQQQSQGGSLSFSSQYGLVDVASLPVVSLDGVAQADGGPGSAQPLAPGFAPAPGRFPAAAQQPGSAAPAEPSGIFLMIEKLADLRGKGVLDEEEFAAKKTELLARL
jgi:hypothetical protein